MLANVFMKTNRDRTLGMLLGSVSIGLMLLFAMAVYRDIDVSLYDSLPPVFLELFGVPEGADVASLAFGAIYSFMGALTLAGLAISMGSASIAGEERNGTIGILLGNPVSRSRVLAAKAASVVLLLFIGGLVMWAAGLWTPEVLGIEIADMRVGAMVFHMTVSALFYGFLALMVGAWTGNPQTASGVSVTIMMVGYLGTSILPFIEQLDGWERVFPWYYFNGSNPTLNGIDWEHMAILGGAALAFLAFGFVGVNRRDLRSKGTKRTLIDRLRDNPRTAAVAEKIAGSARVSGLAMKTVSDHQGMLIITGAIMFYVSILMGPLYALVPDETWAAFSSFPDVLVAMIGGTDMSTVEGFFQAEIFAITMPIAGAVLMISMGSRAIAGEERDHTMGLLLSSPMDRSKIVVTKAWVMVAFGFAFGLVTFLGTWLGVLMGGIDMGIGVIAATSLLGSLLILGFGGFALLLSAATGETSISSWATTAWVAVAYFAFAFLGVNPDTEAWVQLSPYHYFLGGDPLVEGMQWGDALVLAATFVVPVLLAIPAFRRRDLKG